MFLLSAPCLYLFRPTPEPPASVLGQERTLSSDRQIGKTTRAACVARSNDGDPKVTFVRRTIGWLASPKRRAELRRAARPRGCRGSACPCSWTRRVEQDAATYRGRKPP